MEYQIVERFATANWWRQWRFESRPKNTFTGLRGTSNRHLRTHWDAGANLGTDFGFRFASQGYEEPTTLRFEYKIKFGPTFTGGGKLPGFGGTYGRGGWGGRRSDGTNGWSARIGFGAQGLGPIGLNYYVYHIDQPRNTGQGMGAWRVNSVPVALMRDRWYTIQGVCRLNDVGSRNGSLTALLDNVPVYEHNSIRFRTIDALKIEQFWFDCWHGGDETNPAPVDMDVFFDDIVLSWRYT